jgi:hypothetical protein
MRKAVKSPDGTDLSQIERADAGVAGLGNEIAREALRSRALGSTPAELPPDAVARSARGLECLFARTVESMRLDSYIGVTGRLPPISPRPEA